MKQLDLVIHNEAGLHARPAKTLVNLAKTFNSDIKIKHGQKKVNAKSMISVLTLGVKQSGQILIEIDGADEAEASEAIFEAVKSGLGETLPTTNGAQAEEPAEAEVVEPAAVEDANDENRGIGASAGIVSGPVLHWLDEEFELPTTHLGGQAEWSLVEESVQGARSELEALVEKVTADLSAEEAEIFNAHLEILGDPELLSTVKDKIDAGSNGANAWHAACNEQADVMSQLDDELLAARAADVRDVSRRVLSHLLKQPLNSKIISEPSILIARDLSPSDTAKLDKKMVLGFITSEGGPNAHSAIIARALGIPAVVSSGAFVHDIKEGATVILNGGTGEIEVDPSEQRLTEAKEARALQIEAAAKALAAAGERAITTDGHRIEVVGNGGSVADCLSCKENGAEGIGLLRTEFLFLGKESAPSEAAQIEVYRQILETMQERPVIFRTLDIGGDKPVPYISVPNEENPFLGERGVRLMLNHYPELLKTQLTALLKAYKASGVKKMAIMFPMVGQIAEWRKARKMFHAVAKELNISTAGIELGIMVEVPSAALNAHAFAKEADFFSIGTNDLTQYTMAIDRQHPTLAGQADGLDPAVLRLIYLTVQAAHAAKKAGFSLS